MKWARAEGTGIISACATGRCVARDSVVVLNACASAGALESVHDKIIESGCEFDALWGVASLTFKQSVGAWRMLGECSTRCHLGMWSPLLL
jgi:hypothetical protein